MYVIAACAITAARQNIEHLVRENANYGLNAKAKKRNLVIGMKKNIEEKFINSIAI